MGWEFAGIWSEDSATAWQWIWRRIADDSGEVVEASAAFSSFEACMDDARKHGFEAGASRDPAAAA